MDECISNLVVTENFVVQPVENIPISMVEGTYENGLVQLVTASHHTHGGPVIRLTTAPTSAKSTDPHPLEVEVQRDLELRQQQLTQQHTPGIHTLPEGTLQTVVRRSSQFIHMQSKPLEVSQEPIIDESIQLQSVVQNPKNDIQKTNSQITLPHLFHTRPMVLQGKQYFILKESAPLINEWKNRSQENEVIRNLSQSNKPVDEVSQIPLTVQNYNSSTETENNVKIEKLKHNSDSEDEGEEIEPVYDYEPDPESSTPAEAADDADKPNKCYMCFKSFRQKKNMYAHIRKIHSTQPKIEGGILCPLCKMHALRQEHLRNHLETLHDIRIEKEERLFNTINEFLAWKEFVERDTLSLYVSKSSAKLLANNQQKTYYKCHRSGNYVALKKENRKKRLKVQGSNKIGATCPAAMEVTENVHGVNVVFWKTHVGHVNDLKHLTLSKEDRAKLEECLNNGVSCDRVLEKIQKESEKMPNILSRLSLVSKQDLRNIKKIHEMKSCPDLFPARKKINQGRKPMKERMLRRAPQSLIVEKAELLLNLLETTDVIPEFRPKVCLMIDNLISTVKRRAVKNLHRRENGLKKRKTSKWKFDSDHHNNGDSKNSNDACEQKFNENEDASSNSKTDSENSQNISAVDVQSNSLKSQKKRGRPRKYGVDSSYKTKKLKSQ